MTLTLFLMALVHCGGSATPDELFQAVRALDKTEGPAVITNDVVTAAREAAQTGRVKITYDPRRRVDVITLVEGVK